MVVLAGISKKYMIDGFFTCIKDRYLVNLVNVYSYEGRNQSRLADSD